MKVLSEACSRNRNGGKQQTPQHHFGRRHQLQVQGSKQLLVTLCSRIFLGTGKGFGKDIDRVETFVWATDITRIKYVMAVRIQSSSYTATFRFHFLMLKGFKNTVIWYAWRLGWQIPTTRAENLRFAQESWHWHHYCFLYKSCDQHELRLGPNHSREPGRKRLSLLCTMLWVKLSYERLPFLGVQIHTNYFCFCTHLCIFWKYVF